MFEREAGNSRWAEVEAEKVVAKMGLAHVSDTLIGDENVRGVSGGQRKRVSIGMELVSKPLSCVCVMVLRRFLVCLRMRRSSGVASHALSSSVSYPPNVCAACPRMPLLIQVRWFIGLVFIIPVLP